MIALFNAWHGLAMTDRDDCQGQLGWLLLVATGIEQICDAHQVVGTEFEPTIRAALGLLDSFAKFDMLTPGGETEPLRRATKRARGLVGSR